MLKNLHRKWKGVKKNLVKSRDNEVTEETNSVEESVIYKDDEHKIPEVKNIKFDVVLKVEENSFQLHRNVLARSSKFFERMFSTEMKEKYMKEITMEGIEFNVFKDLISFIYTGRIKIHNGNALNLLITSDYLDIKYVRNVSEKFLTDQLRKEINNEKHDRSFCDVLEIRVIANSLQCNQLFFTANKFIAFNLKQFMNSNEFLSMNFHQFIVLIKSDDFIIHCTEETTLKACMSWIGHDDEGERMSKKDEILAIINSCHREYNPGKICAILHPGQSMKIYDLIEKRWSKGESTPMMPFWEGVVAVKGNIYFIGQSNMEYQGENKWIRRNKMITPRSNPLVAVSEDIIYTFGGRMNDVVFVRNVECYDPNTDIWQELTPMNEYRHNACAVALNGYIYILGGSDSKMKITNSVSRLDPKRNCWEAIKPMIQKRSCFGATIFEGKIYVCGGFDENHCSLSSVEIYDPKQDNWVKGPSMNSRRACFPLLSAIGKIFAMGGMNNKDLEFRGCKVLDFMEIFDPRTAAWSIESSIHMGHINAAVVIP